MFESENEDWDVDENFLKDADNQAMKFYSQVDNREDGIPAKRLKLDGNSDSMIFSSDAFDEEWSAMNCINEKISTDAKRCRKDLILGIFNEKHSVKHNLQSSCNTNARENDETYDETEKLNELSLSKSSNTSATRKNFILEIIKTGNTKEKDNTLNKIDTNPERSGMTNNSKVLCNSAFQTHNHQDLQNTENNNRFCITSKSNKENQFTDKSKIAEEKHKTSSFVYKNHNLSAKAENENEGKLFNDYRKQLLSKALNCPIDTNATKNISRYNTIFNVERQPSEKLTLIRKFPGPAGLLPDVKDNAIPPVSYLNNLDETENDKLQEPKESNLSDYCSQNTKDLFTEGAWQLMLNDLPVDFLKGYEISTIKQIANTRCRGYMRVPYVAGVLESIDHNAQDPPITLKDFTDSIQGIIHRDIPVSYPGSLEPNVVILLRDVGLLRISSGSLVTNKYQILISPSNLMGIYSNKGDIVRTEQMKLIVRNNSQGRSKEESENDSKKYTGKNFYKNNNKIAESNSDIFGSFDESDNFSDDTSDSSFTADIRETTNITSGNPQTEKKFGSPVCKQIQNIIKKPMNNEKFQDKNPVQETIEKKRESLLQTLRKFAPNKSNETVVSTSKQLDSGFRVLEIAKMSDGENLLQSESKKPSSNDSINSVQQNDRKSNSLKSKLLQFRSKDELTPTESVNPKIEETSEKGAKDQNVDFAGNIFDESENDTDDELLSQVDVDSIFSNYNNSSN